MKTCKCGSIFQPSYQKQRICPECLSEDHNNDYGLKSEIYFLNNIGSFCINNNPMTTKARLMGYIAGTKHRDKKRTPWRDEAIGYANKRLRNLEKGKK